MGNWVYRRTADGMFQVGYYRLPWLFVEVDVFVLRGDAEERVHYLNGGS